MAMVRIDNDQEKAFLFKLLDEFGSKVIRRRNLPTSTDHGHYAIADITEDEFDGTVCYELFLPTHYTNFINYLIAKNFRRTQLPHTS